MKKLIWVLVLLLILSASGCADSKAPSSLPEPEISDTASDPVSTPEPVPDNSAAIEAIGDRLASVQAQSAFIRSAFENEVMTQSELNMKSQELYTLWNDLMVELLEELQKILPQEDRAQLQSEQSAWEAQRDTAVEAAGKDYLQGSLYAFVTNEEAASITQARVEQLYELLK